MSLIVEGLTGGYVKDVAVIDGLDLAVGPGEAVGVVGRNGSGKTCLAGSLLGLLPARAARICVGDSRIDQAETRRRIRSGLALVPEGRMVFAQLTVHENLVAAAYGTGRRLEPRRLSEIHEAFPVLREKADAPAGSLSGGEQQWVAIARALVQEPRAIVLDEPSLGLSPVAVEALGDALVAIRDRGVALLLLEQNPALLRSLCSEVLVMRRGTFDRSLSGEVLGSDDAFAAALLEG